MDASSTSPIGLPDAEESSVCLHEGYFTGDCAVLDPAIAQLVDKEGERQREAVELVASENFVSRAVLEAQGSLFSNKTVVGYPGARFHAGAEFADQLERIAIARAAQAFDCRFANVQPHSGIQANLGVFRALLQSGDTVLSMSGSAGGHFSHGAQSNLSGAMANAVFYGVSRETGLIDYDEVRRLALEHRPKLIVAGGAAYSRAIDVEALRKVADEIGARVLVDVAHFAGLIVAGVHPHPFPTADIVTTTTYKSLRGARGGLVLWNDPALSSALASAVVPGVQGSPLLHMIAAKAVGLGEALRPEFKEYGRKVLANARAFADELLTCGIAVTTGGTDTPLVIADLRAQSLLGQVLVESLDRAGITCNRCEIPFDDVSPTQTSGLRFGLSAMTTRGLNEKEVRLVARWIAEIVAAHAGRIDDVPALEMRIRADVGRLMDRYPFYAVGGDGK